MQVVKFTIITINFEISPTRDIDMIVHGMYSILLGSHLKAHAVVPAPYVRLLVFLTDYRGSHAVYIFYKSLSTTS